MPVKAKTKAKKSVKPVAAPVGIAISPQMQYVFVVCLGLAWAVLGVPALYVALTSPPNAYGNITLFESVLPTLIPPVLFGVAFWYVGRIGNILARLFRAALLTVVGIFGYILLQMTLSYLPQLLDTGYATTEAIERQQIIVNIGTVVLFGGILLTVKWRRSRRG